DAAQRRDEDEQSDGGDDQQDPAATRPPLTARATFATRHVVTGAHSPGTLLRTGYQETAAARVSRRIAVSGRIGVTSDNQPGQRPRPPPPAQPRPRSAPLVPRPAEAGRRAQPCCCAAVDRAPRSARRPGRA